MLQLGLTFTLQSDITLYGKEINKEICIIVIEDMFKSGCI